MVPDSHLSFLTRFQLSSPAGYQHKALERVALQRNHAIQKAAVLIGITERPEGATILFTKRASHLAHHAGQISFPGGKYEPSDDTLAQTAIREAGEEIGLEPQNITVIGHLPDIITISGFCVTPIISTITPDYRIAVNHGEVAELFEVPVSYLLNPQHLHHYPTRIRGDQHEIFAVIYRHHFIWGMTGQIIASLQRQLVF